jgi:long-chain fatty acid transport protein
MKHFAVVTAAMLAATSGAYAGGVERSTQSVAILFEQGRYAELNFGRFAPDVSGTVGGGLLSSGDMAADYNSWSLGYKMDIGDRMAFALVLDEPIGANVSYAAGTGYPLAGTTAELSSSAITGLLRYSFDNNVSLIGGVRAQSVKGVVNIIAPGIGLADYGLETSRELDFGYVVGVAWEKPEIAARVALTYNSAITHDLASTETGLAPVPLTGSFETEVPQSLNLEFQTGIAKDTLLFGSIRWVEWTAFNISPPVYSSPAAVDDALVAYASDRITYNLGVGRRFNETWSGAVTLGYEKPDGEPTGNLGPTDGFKSIGLAATYTRDNMKITGGIRYVDIGDATTSIGAAFEDNSGIGVGVRIGYTF